MILKLKNPLAFFDLETTGINVVTDRIVEICIIKLMPTGERQTVRHLVNPTIAIPIESSLIHGIYDEDVKNQPTFKELAKNLSYFLEGADLAGFNVIKFDIPMLVEEFLRADVPFDVSKRKVVDVQKIFHLMEPRNLSAAYKFYCQKDLENAHSAEADTLATLEVLEAQVARYDNLAIKDRNGKEYIPVKNDVTALHELTFTKVVDLAGRMVYNNKGEIVFNFGKHINKPVTKVLLEEPSYFDWMLRGDFALDTKRRLTEIKLSMMKK